MKKVYTILPIFLVLGCCCSLFSNNLPNNSGSNLLENYYCPGSDADEDGVCDSDDICPGFDDSIDMNGNGTPDGCDGDSSPSCIEFTFNPPDKTAACGSAISFDQPVAVDNCCQGTITYTFIDSEDNPSPGCQEFTRIWIAESSCGNLATAKQTVTYLDTEPPEFVIDHPILSFIDNCDTITVDCEDGFFVSNGDVTATDNCDSNPTVALYDEITNGNCPNDGFTKFMLCYWIASDNCENRDTFKVYIKFVDNTAPLISCPDDVEVECMDELDPADLGTPWVGDNCSDSEDIDLEFVDADPVMDGCATTIERTWTATDECGNMKTCVQTITRNDNTPPVITCPADAVIDCDATPDPAITGTATAIDDCSSIDNITFEDNVQVLDACETQITRLWIAADACGNLDSCFQVIISRDLTAPTINCPADANLECGASIDPADTGSPTGTDNCDPNLDYTFEDAVFIINDCETIIERTWTATDNCNNASSCMQLLKLTDTQPPSITCPANVTVECTDSIEPSNTGTATATDACDTDLTITYEDVTQADTCETTITRTWTATDNCGNTDTCSQIINLTDTTAPEITCPDNITVECDTPIDPTMTGMPTATDNCDMDVEITAEEFMLVTTDCEILFNWVFTATDNCGNTATCTQLVTVNDSTPPEITCPDHVTVECDDNTDPSNTGMATGMDNCDDEVDITFSDVSNAVDDCTTIITRTWTATNDCGAITTCDQLITINDSQAPMITCPEDVIVECDGANDPASTGMATATDNCDTDVTITFVDVTTQINDCETIIERTFTATDNCGNSVSCMQTIKILDTTTPLITCPDNVTVECDASTDPATTGEPTASDNCATGLTFTFEDVNTTIDDCTSQIERTWTTTDACGNMVTCVQIITITDTTMPVIICPVDVTIECTDSTAPADTGTATATDNCATGLLVTFTDVTTTIDVCTTEIKRSWTTADACGNEVFCTQTITITDFTAPMITCPSDISVDCDANTDITATGEPTTTDNCSMNLNFINSDNTTPIDDCISQIERTWFTTDDCGNVSSCVQIITVTDMSLPTITCPADASIECDMGMSPAALGMPTASDNCDMDLTISNADVSTFADNCTEIFERTWMATDDCGNEANCIQTITVEDTTPPVVTCPADVTVECNTDFSTAVTGEATATDNCTTATIFPADVTNVIDDCTTEVARTFQAFDVCGNMSECTQIITITDTTTPTITCPQDMTIECDASTDPSSTGEPFAADNCDADLTVTFVDDVTNPDDCISIIKRTWTAEDNCGNQATCVQFIQIEDTVAPSITCPADANVECNTASDPTVTGMATATDNCDDDLDITSNDVTISQDNCQTVIERTWTAVDNCGNTATCVQTITIADTTTPTITCPADASIECDMDMSPATLGMPTASDNCDMDLTISNTDVSTFADNCTEIFERTWTATDDCGNEANCIQTITVEDTTPPVVTCPADVTVECNTDFSTAVTGEATATDNCTTATIFPADVTNVIDDCTTEVARTFQAFDVCGNMSECTQIITITDTTTPTITCPQDMTIECDASTDPSNTGEPFAADNCDADLDVTFVDDVTMPDDCISIIKRTWTAEDNCGNQATCVQFIQIEDTVAPVITCPADANVECDAAFDPTVTGMATATDNCDDDLDITSNDVTISQDNCQTVIERTWTAVDNCGNTATCVQTITIADTTTPTITCPADASIECDMDMSPATLGMPTASDNCDMDLTISNADVSTFADNCTEIFERTWTAIDDCGNEANCIQTITVEDTTAPVVICPADVTVECNTDFSTAITGEATATDNCTTATIFPADVTNVIDDCTTEVARTFQAFDVCGNMSECTQIITITDTTTPTITCPQDMTIECDASTDPSNTGEPFAADNCDADLTVTFVDDVTNPDDCISIIKRTWTAEDNCGNQATCVQFIQIEDTVAPVITCPADANVECDAAFDPTVTGMATATDNCDDDLDITSNDVTISQDDCQTIIERTWTAVDNCGNTATCVQTITIADTTTPTITCPTDVSIECDMDMSPATLGMPTASDNCDMDLTISNTDVSTFMDNCTEIFERTWTATDDCGNEANCIQTITVEDTTAPVVTCPANVTVECNTDFSTAVTGEATATDNCTTATIFPADVTNVIDDCTTEVARTFQVFDVCGNMSECTQIITITDTTTPTITCSQDMTIECDASTDPSSTGEPFAADNCDADLTVTFVDDVTNPDDCISIIKRTWTAEDNCGNQATCVQFIQIEDTVAPSITCPADANVECDAAFDPTVTGMATATDNCDTDLDITFNDVTISQDNCQTVIERTWTAVDNCGNTATCVQTITIADTTTPTITCPADASIECDMDMSPATLGTATAMDNCDMDLTISNTDVSTFADNCTEIFERTWAATDDCGNEANCIQTITVEDTTPPVVTCPADVTVECNTDFSTAVTGEATATDNCTTATIFPADVTNVIDDCTTEVARTFQAFDVCGNMSECTQIITITDTTTPTITCPQDMTIECDASTDPSNTGEPFAADNCDADLTVTFVDDVTNPDDCISIIKRTWTAEDNCGNQATCVQFIQIEDTVAPVITCPADVVTNCNAPIDPANTGMATATDACDDDLSITFNDEVAASSDCEIIYNRTWTATDNCGNVSTCIQQISVTDTDTPTISCPADASIECDMDMSPAALGMATAMDNCDTNLDISSMDNSISVDNCTEVFERTWTAVDNCGNEASCIQTITVEDITAPVLTCPTDVTIECNTDFSTTATGEATAIDNCAMASIFPADVTNTIDDCTTEITRTFQAFDVCGNMSECSQIITITDTTTPTITCAPDMTVECDAVPTMTPPTASDNCDTDLEITFEEVSTNIDACTSEIKRTYTAVDNCGNQASCVQIIQIEDMVAPSITCPADVDTNCDAPIDPANTGMATATDNCDDDLTITFNDVTASVTDCEIIYERTWTAVDNCGNAATCTQLIKVTDTDTPVLTCPADLTIDCTSMIDPTVTGVATATDNCDMNLDILYQDDVNVINSCVTEITRTWTAADDCGNAAMCIQIITVEDTAAPQIFCPGDAVLTCDGDISPSITGQAGATDNCDDNVDVTFTDNTIIVDDCTTTIERTWTATDDCGLTATCMQTITLTDTDTPVITCPADMTIECDASTDPTNTGMATATDNCDTDVTITFSDVSTPINDCQTEIKRVWSAMDDCGQVALCTQTIIVNDTNAPIITCPADAAVSCGGSTDPMDTGMATATDNCDADVTITFSDVTTTNTDCDIVIERTWTATDNCNNVATCVQLISTSDSGAPVITCPADVLVECNASTDPANTGMATATDDCDNDIFITSTDDVTVVDDCETQIKRTWIATDDCGNTDTCVQIITVQDQTAPMITTCPADITIDCTVDPTPATTGMATATDNCDNDVTITFTDDMMQTAACTETITRTWVATDNCGNTVSCMQTITQTDDNAPVLTFDHPILNGSNHCDTIMLECGEVPMWTIDDVDATDLCDATPTVTVSESSIMGDCLTDGFVEIQTVQWIAVDDCDNADTLKIIIKTQDTTPPVITPMDPAIAGTMDGDTLVIDCEDFWFLGNDAVQAVDACGNATLTFEEEIDQNDCVGNGLKVTLTCSWIAVDDCENRDTFTLIMQIVDNTAPALIGVPADVTVECANIPDPANVMTDDGCDADPTLVFEQTENVNGPNDCNIIRKWTTMDECGNTASAVQVITISDCVGCFTPMQSQFLDFGVTSMPGEQVDLQWTFTATPYEHAFVVQRSADNANWKDLGIVEGIVTLAGQSDSYEFMDESPREGNNYYRIKAINLTDGIVYSHSEYLRFDDLIGLNAFVFPNPTVDAINIELVGEAKGEVTVQISNELGQVLIDHKMEEGAILEKISLRELQNGVYFVWIMDSGRRPMIVKVVKAD